MIKLENEIKMMLNKEQYNYLLKLLSAIPSKEINQINYYYDTADESLRKKNITMRIRQKDGKLKGTIKKHHFGKVSSTEEDFRVDLIPNIMMFDSEVLYLKGNLSTHRSEFLLSDSISIMIDKNEYLGLSDYELELEYGKDSSDYVEHILLILKKLLRKDHFRGGASKSERFFRQLVLNR